MGSLQIYLIDDDKVFRGVLARSLSKLSCQVTDFATPLEAIQQMPESDEIIVLLDLKLEDDSGLRWIKQLKQKNSNTRLVLLTAYASISTAVEAIKLGADDYLAKPITAREILLHLEKSDADPEIPIDNKPMSVDRLEWEHIHKVLADNDGNVSATARALGMHRRTLQRKLAKRPTKH